MSETADQSSTSPAADSQPSPVDAFGAMPRAEKMLAAAATAVLVAFLFSKSWHDLFADWFITCALIGSAAVLALIIVDLFGIRFMDAKVRMWTIIILALLPAAGFVIGKIMKPWNAAMLAGAIVMGLAAVKITTRENILKR